LKIVLAFSASLVFCSKPRARRELAAIQWPNMHFNIVFCPRIQNGRAKLSADSPRIQERDEQGSHFSIFWSFYSSQNKPSKEYVGQTNNLSYFAKPINKYGVLRNQTVLMCFLSNFDLPRATFVNPPEKRKVLILKSYKHTSR
jgi:hypothetical protein